MPVVYFFSLQVDPAHRQALLDVLLEHGRDCTARELGTLRFDVLEDDADPARLYLYEAYADQAAFQAHAGGRPAPEGGGPPPPAARGRDGDLRRRRPRAQPLRPPRASVASPTSA